jgi:glycosyltransferase involved in cell wall biosynthesis
MGRYVRAVLRDLVQRAQIGVTLLVRDPRDAPAYRAIAGDRIEVAPLAAARRARTFDRVWYPWNGIRFAAAAPALVTINDDFAFAYPARGFIARRREQQPVRRAIRDAAYLTTISAWSRDALIGRFALQPARIGIIPLVPDPYFSPGSERPPFAEPFVLAVGAGDCRKNVSFLLDVFARAFPAGDVRLVIVGAVPPALDARLRRSTLPVSNLTGVDDAGLRRLYRTAAAVAVPSLAEGFGLVAAEAQACAAAVIAADASALPEAVGDAGRLVDPRDRSGWSAALRELVCNSAVNAHFRERAAARWAGASAHQTADALLAALERTIDDRP